MSSGLKGDLRMRTLHRGWKPKGYYLGLIVSVLLILTPLSYGQTDARRNYEFLAELFVTPKNVENATGVPSGQKEIGEMQTEYGVSLLSLWASEWSEINIDYQYSKTRFSKDSEQEGTFRDGSSSFVLGNETSVYQISLDHSIRRVLREPNAVVTILDNSEERQITSLMPLLRARFDEANSLAIAFSFSDVNFEDSKENSSERKAAQLQYLRDVSPIASFLAVMEQTHIDYDLSNSADYEMSSVTVELSVEHRIFSYSLQVGVSKIQPDSGEPETSSTFGLTLGSEIVGNRFELFAKRLVSDTSTGSGNDGFFSSQASFDGGSEGQDQLLRTELGFSWDYDLLCGRCGFVASIGKEKSEHFHLTENDSSETFYDIRFTYGFSRRLNAVTSIRQTKTDISDLARLSSSGSQLSGFELRYQLNRNFEINLMYEREKRIESGAGMDSKVDTTSLSATWRFE